MKSADAYRCFNCNHLYEDIDVEQSEPNSNECPNIKSARCDLREKLQLDVWYIHQDTSFLERAFNETLFAFKINSLFCRLSERNVDVVYCLAQRITFDSDSGLFYSRRNDAGFYLLPSNFNLEDYRATDEAEVGAYLL